MSIELKQAAQQAIEALEWYVENDDVVESMPGNEFWVGGKREAEKAIQELRTAIQQAESEPVGEPRARVELMKTGGNVGLSTRIIELDIATRERLRPGDLLYTHPERVVTDDVVRDAIATVREQYRGTDWGKAAECICDAIDAAMLAAK